MSAPRSVGSGTGDPGQGHAHPPGAVAEVVRSGFVESRHRAAVVALAADGTIAYAAGDVTAPIFPRSSNKPMQAVGMLRSGLALEGELLALAMASHSGEAFHIAGVRRILAAAGLDESALQTPPDWPLNEEAAREVVRAGGGPAPLLMNCSGKHAAMLATSVAAGWDPATYRDPDSPLQQALLAATEDLAGEQVAAVGIDGCGAPLFALSLLGLARAFAAIAGAVPGSPERRLADAAAAHPAFVGGTGRDVTQLLQAVPGLLAKDGAEGVYAAALPDGRAVAIKVEDGAGRPRPALVVAALRRLGVVGPDVDAALDAVADTPVLGHGQRVGEVRVTL